MEANKCRKFTSTEQIAFSKKYKLTDAANTSILIWHVLNMDLSEINNVVLLEQGI